MIVRSVKKEILQREELTLANENQQLLIRFITHQVKGFFTRSKMVFASILEGDFGQAPDTMMQIVKDGLDSDSKAVDMVQEVLNASSLRNGQMPYSFQGEDLVSIIKPIVESFRQLAEDKGLEYVFDLSLPTISTKVDKIQISQAFKNLIDNSIKYTQSGSVKMTLGVKNNMALFTISDTGVGLSDKDKSVLFKEGGRGDESLKFNVNSTGYGLFIVKKIVEGHDGHIWAESAGRGHGSHFYVEIPIIVK
jgi:signal transduction histidine kinase